MLKNIYTIDVPNIMVIYDNVKLISLLIFGTKVTMLKYILMEESHFTPKGCT